MGFVVAIPAAEVLIHVPTVRRASVRTVYALCAWCRGNGWRFSCARF